MKKAILMLAAMVLFAAPAFADLVTNGSFENGINPPPPPNFRTIYAGTPEAGDITGWIVTSNSIDWIGDYWQAADGSRSIDMSGWYAAGTITVSQALATTPGQEYLLTFYMAGNPDSGPTVKTLNASVDGKSADFTFNITGHSKSSMGWEKKTLAFTATETATNLSFMSLTGDSAWGPALDNVSVTAIPAPAAIGLGVLGLALVGWVKRRIA